MYLRFSCVVPLYILHYLLLSCFVLFLSLSHLLLLFLPFFYSVSTCYYHYFFVCTPPPPLTIPPYPLEHTHTHTHTHTEYTFVNDGYHVLTNWLLIVLKMRMWNAVQYSTVQYGMIPSLRLYSICYQESMVLVLMSCLCSECCEFFIMVVVTWFQDTEQVEM